MNLYLFTHANGIFLEIIPPKFRCIIKCPVSIGEKGVKANNFGGISIKTCAFGTTVYQEGGFFILVVVGVAGSGTRFRRALCRKTLGERKMVLPVQSGLSQICGREHLSRRVLLDYLILLAPSPCVCVFFSKSPFSKKKKNLFFFPPRSLSR